MSSRQSQNGGDHSNQIQGGGDVTLNQNVTNNNGLSYTEAKDLFLTLFRDNFYEMRGQAMETVAARAEEVTVKFLQQMQKRSPNGVVSANDPAMQRALVTAQTEYACSGDEDLSDILVDILVDRAQANTGTLQAIVLSEALNAAPKLTSGQIAALTISLAMRYTHFYGWQSPVHFYENLGAALRDAATVIATEKVSYAHMSYVGVGTISVGEWNIFQRCSELYPGVFTRGFTLEEIPEELRKFEALFIPAWRDVSRRQLVFSSLEMLERTITEGNPIYPHIDQLKHLIKLNIMTEIEIETDLRTNMPGFSPIVDAWKSTQLKSFDLSSVGFAIGQANWRRSWGSVPLLDIYFEQ